MSQEPTHIVHYREGKAKPEKVNDAQLKQMRETIVGFKDAYTVTPIKEVEKPEPLAPARPPRAAAATSAGTATADAAKTE